MLVSALYNIVDQFFIGQSIGTLGNAATNIVFPLSTSCVALALLFGIGGASTFNLAMGAKEEKTAAYYIGNAATLLFTSGVVLWMLVWAFNVPLLRFFGSPEEVLAYARPYSFLTAMGFPFVIFATGGGHLVRADGSPKYTMLFNLAGAIINTILDPILIFGFHMGMEGAAIATVTGQVVSAYLAFRYLRNYKSVKIQRIHLLPKWNYVKRIIMLGASPFFNQIAIMIVQIVMNNLLSYYGALSIYGESIPLACSGIIAKVNMIYFSIVIGISQGLQPIVSFNYGARNYDRVKEAYKLALKWGFIISVISFVIFQTIPRQIVGLFGSGSELYYEFGVSYFRIFLFFTFTNFVQAIASNFFTAIGKPMKGILLSLTRQILFFLPFAVILPMYFGINGVMYAGPIADFMAAVTGILLSIQEVRRMNTLVSQYE